MGIGVWGLGIWDWGLGPIPNPQSPIPNPQSPFIEKFIIKILHLILIFLKTNKSKSYYNYLIILNFFNYILCQIVFFI